MECREAQERIGAYLDGELPQDVADDLRRHVAGCDACARALQKQEELIRALVAVDPAGGISAPPNLWQAVEARLDSPADAPRRETHRLISFFRKPLAIAASIAVFLGVGTFTVLMLTESAQVAEATQVDYTVLLDGLSGRVDAAIERFLAYYDAQPIPASEAHAAAPALSFAVPPRLPGDFVLRQAYRVRFGEAPGVAAVYERGEEPLVVFFHPTVDGEKCGTYRQRPCIIGERHGHQVQVGDWRLLHFMDPTTCHCVLTKLGPGSRDLSEIVHIVAPDYASPADQHGHR
jgi:hypothetical protein